MTDRDRPDGSEALHWFEPYPDGDPSEIRKRFYDIKDAMQDRRNREVTNYDVFDVLCELFWVHDEAGGVESPQPVLADGGVRACDQHPDREAAVVTDDGEARCEGCQLRAALREPTSSDGPRKRCPECKTTKIHERISVRTGEADGPQWWCKECGADFDRPYRAPEQQTLAPDGGLSISADELEARKQAKSITPANQRKRCPECGSTHITRKTGKWDTGCLDRGRWRCKELDCLTHFDQPVTGGAP